MFSCLHQGRLQHRIALTGSGEFSIVARSMNAMAEALEQHREREAAQRHELEDEMRERTREAGKNFKHGV